MTREVYLVLLEFGQQHEQASLELLIPTLHRVFPRATLRSAIVDNALTGDCELEIGHDTIRLSGDNTLHEFSGWDRGIAWLERRHAPVPESIFVLANDTVVRADKHDRVRDIPADRVEAASDGALVGWVDEYPRPVELFGLSHPAAAARDRPLRSCRVSNAAVMPVGRRALPARRRAPESGPWSAETGHSGLLVRSVRLPTSAPIVVRGATAGRQPDRDGPPKGGHYVRL